MITATRIELAKLYSRWANLSPYALIAVALALVATNVAKLGGPVGLEPRSSIVLYFPLLMWWLPGTFVLVASAGQLGAEHESGALRTILVTPIARGRLLIAKYLACVIHALALTAFTGTLACLLRWALFGHSDAPLLAGTETAMELLRPDQHPVCVLEGCEAFVRASAAYAYLWLFLCALAALALLISSAMRHGMGAVSVAAAAVVLMWVASSAEPLAPVRPYLLVDHGRGWLWILSGIPDAARIVGSIGCCLAYTAGCLVGAQALLAGRDVHA